MSEALQPPSASVGIGAARTSRLARNTADAESVDNVWRKPSQTKSSHAPRRMQLILALVDASMTMLNPQDAGLMPTSNALIDVEYATWSCLASR